MPSRNSGPAGPLIVAWVLSACGGGGNAVRDAACGGGDLCGSVDAPPPPPVDATVGDVDIPVGPTCSDGAKNGKETDIDCGGGACTPCASTSTCSASEDCAS